MRKPIELRKTTILLTYRAASAVTGDDFKRAYRIIREIRQQPWFIYHKESGAFQVVADFPEPFILQWKNTDPAKVWAWIKKDTMQYLTPTVMDMLEIAAEDLDKTKDLLESVGKFLEEEDGAE